MEIIRVRKSSLNLNIAPLIDVVFLLLIFFMLTSHFANPSIQVNLPKAVTKDTPQEEQIIISIKRSGELYINHQKTSFRFLKTDLQPLLSADTKKAVHIKGDADMPYRYFVEAMDSARQAGATNVNIVYQEGK